MQSNTSLKTLLQFYAVTCTCMHSLWLNMDSLAPATSLVLYIAEVVCINTNKYNTITHTPVIMMQTRLKSHHIIRSSLRTALWGCLLAQVTLAFAEFIFETLRGRVGPADPTSIDKCTVRHQCIVCITTKYKTCLYCRRGSSTPLHQGVSLGHKQLAFYTCLTLACCRT